MDGMDVANLTEAGGRDLFSTLQAELLNEIFMHIVVHRDYRTGEKRPIILEHFLVISRRALRLSKVCEMFHNTMVPMFFGQNTFVMTVRDEGVSSYCPERVDVNGRIRTGFPKAMVGTFFLDTVAAGHGLGVARSTLDREYRDRQAMLIPTKAQRKLLKNIIINININKCPQDQRFGPRDRRDVTTACGMWFQILRSANWLGDFNLESITLALRMYQERDMMDLHPQQSSAGATYEKSKEVIKEYIDALLAPVKAGKKDISWPVEW